MRSVRNMCEAGSVPLSCRKGAAWQGQSCFFYNYTWKGNEKMPKLNENYLNVQDSYLFAEIARRVSAYEESHPDKAGDIIRGERL